MIPYRIPDFLRKQVIRNYNGECPGCHRRLGQFEMHHLTYVRYTCEDPWDLMPVCGKCHRKITKLCRKGGKKRSFVVPLTVLAATAKITGIPEKELWKRIRPVDVVNYNPDTPSLKKHSYRLLSNERRERLYWRKSL